MKIIKKENGIRFLKKFAIQLVVGIILTSTVWGVSSLAPDVKNAAKTTLSTSTDFSSAKKQIENLWKSAHFIEGMLGE